MYDWRAERLHSLLSSRTRFTVADAIVAIYGERMLRKDKKYYGASKLVARVLSRLRDMGYLKDCGAFWIVLELPSMSVLDNVVSGRPVGQTRIVEGDEC